MLQPQWRQNGTWMCFPTTPLKAESPMCNRKPGTLNLIYFRHYKPLFVCITVNWTERQQDERPGFQGVSWKPLIKLTVLFFLIKKITIFALKMHINFKWTFESYTVKRPVPRSWDSEKQMACYLCFGTRSSWILLETSLAAFRGDLKFLDVIQHLW